MDQVRPTSGKLALRPRLRRLVDLILHEHHQATAPRRSRTEASPRRSDDAKGIDSSKPVTEARMERSVIRDHHLQLACRPRVSLRSTRATNSKGGGTPAGAVVQTSAPYGRGSREASRARLPAFHRGTCGSERTPPLSSSTCFLGPG